jgi:uncharacterized protein (DUF1501 family)
VVCLPGGPSHQETWDPKPGALADVRGEIGRTPKINKNTGRDHWAAAIPALLAGGGIRHGQIIGACSSI